MPAMSEEWDVFIAHSSADTAIARELFHHLQDRCRVFFDESALRLGDDWHMLISTAQRASRYTVVLVSATTDRSYYEREEIAAAIDLARHDAESHRVVPIYLDGAPDESVPYGLRLKQGIVLDRTTTIESVAARLMTEMKTAGSSGSMARSVTTLRLVLADDSLPMRRGVCALLELEQDIEVVGECESLDDLLATVERAQPDVVITDLRMPPTRTNEGVVAANHMRTTHPEIAVVLLTQYADPESARALVEHGSRGRGYLLKEHVSRPDHLFAAIRAVASGGSYIDPEVVEALVSARSAGSAVLHRLSPREREVLAEVASGLSNQAIGQRLFISERAVEKHINSIFTKLDLFGSADTNRRVQAALLFLASKSTSADLGVDLEIAEQPRDTDLQVGEAPTLGEPLGPVVALARVGHLERHRVVVAEDPDAGSRAWTGVLGGVLERFGAAVVDRQLQRGRELARQLHVDSRRMRAQPGQPLQASGSASSVVSTSLGSIVSAPAPSRSMRRRRTLSCAASATTTCWAPSCRSRSSSRRRSRDAATISARDARRSEFSRSRLSFVER
jgi:DNA-binding NarL/FixJ family response regulator